MNRSCQQSDYLYWISIIATALAGAAIGYSVSRRLQMESKEDENGLPAFPETSSTPKSQKDNNAAPPFPWEAKSSRLSLSDSERRKAAPWNDTTKKHCFSQQSANEQLQFLSQMTFANGGMRAPSCPCCF